MAEKAKDDVRIIVCIDTTGSMGSYCTAVGSMLQQLFVMLDVLFEGSAKVDIVAYEDYCDGKNLLRTCTGTREQLTKFAAELRAGGGGDAPEAAKTAFNKIAEMLRASEQGASGRTLVIHYTDAPPHHGPQAGVDPKSNPKLEQKALEGKEPGYDWVQICKAFKTFGTEVITFLPRAVGCEWFYSLLGKCVKLPDSQPETITKFTMGVLLQLMGQPFEELAIFDFADAWDLGSLKDEMDAKIVKTVQVFNRTFESHAAFSRDLRCLIDSFKSSTKFQDLVFEALKDLFVPSRVLAITYNSVLGALWRLVCKEREDPRLQPLCDALSTCSTSLTGSNQTQLRTWIDESYDQLGEITELVQAVADPLVEGILLLDVKGADMPTKEEMRSLIHSPIPGVLRKVQSLLTRLLVVHKGQLPATEDGTPMYIPLGMKDKDLFGCLSHLLLPGLMLSLRPAAMMAIMAYCSGNAVLADRAKRFLEAWKGNWIPPVEKAEDYPEVLNGEFVRLVVRVPDFLTDAERALYQRLHHITRVRRAANLRLQVRVGYTPKLIETHADSKRKCGKCGQMRSFTLMVDGTCGLCLSESEEIEQFADDGSKPSHLAECRTCQAVYAVVDVEACKVAPKCHYCRQRGTAPTVRCQVCQNKFCAPTASDIVDDWVCPPCVVNKDRATPAREVELIKLIDDNPCLLGVLGFKDSAKKMLFDRIGLFKLWMGFKDDVAAVEAATPTSLVWAGKPVMNVEEVLTHLLDRIKSGKLSDMCNLCFEDKPLPALQSSCGRCPNLACQDCLSRWYGQIKPGRLYIPSEGLCAFCKCTPKGTTLRKFNRTAMNLHGRKDLVLDAGFYYGWCRNCFKIKEAVPRDCARDAPALQNWQCTDCEEARLVQDTATLEANAKKCPGCQVPTVKAGGCNHITCTQCPAHWCWQCGGEFPEDEIYDHMEEVHGSIFAGEPGYDSEFSDQD